MNTGFWSRLSLTCLGLITLGVAGSLAGSNSGVADTQKSTSKAEVTFDNDVAPIIFNNCAVCHHTGGSGPFSLLNYQDVRSHAKQIAVVTASRYMPPWLPGPGYGKFVGERRLTDEQIQTIQRWVAGGMQEGVAADLPPIPTFSDDWELGKPDLVVQLPQPYVLLAGANTDSWPRFVLPVPVSGTRYVRGVEIRPGNPKIVHYCYIAVDRTQTLHIAKGQIYEVGTRGMDGQFDSGNAELDSRFLTWRPGSPLYFEPEGMAWRLDKDTDLIPMMHLLTSGKSESIQLSVEFYFSDKPLTKTPMIVRLEQDGNIDIPAAAKDFEISDDLELRTNVKVLPILPHAHYLCKEMRVFATLPDGTRKWLIWVKRWNFDWQGVFRYEEPVDLPRRTVLSMRYTYDNSSDNARNPNTPPQRVVRAQKSTEEMADAWLEVLPERREDLFALEIAMMRHKLAKYPQEPSGYADLGAALRAMGRNQQTIGPLREAAQLNPNNVQVQNNLGAVLGSLGNFDEAISHFCEALNLRPDYFMACTPVARRPAGGHPLPATSRRAQSGQCRGAQSAWIDPGEARKTNGSNLGISRSAPPQAKRSSPSANFEAGADRTGSGTMTGDLRTRAAIAALSFGLVAAPSARPVGTARTGQACAPQSNGQNGPAPSAGATKKNPQDGMQYVWIPSGSFMMGCSTGDDQCSSEEKPAR